MGHKMSNTKKIIRAFSVAFLLAGIAVFPNPVAAETIGPPIVVDRNEQGPLRKGEVFETQIRLSILGFDVGTPDGIAGRKTNSALAAFSKAQGINDQNARTLLYSLRNATAIDASPAPGPPALPPCEEGAYSAGFMYIHVQGIQHWADPIDPSIVDAERDKGTWAKVYCRDSQRVERVEHYTLGELVSTAHYSYDICCNTPAQIQFQDKEGKVLHTVRLGRTPQGHITHAVGIGSSGEANRLIPITPTERGTLWTTLTFDGQVISRQYNDYWLSDYVTGITLYHGPDNRNKYIYFIENGTLPTAFDRFLNGEKIHEARITRDGFGLVSEEKIRLMGSESGTYYNRYFENGRLVKEERDTGAGEHLSYVREYTDNGLDLSKLSVNGKLRGELKIVRDGVEPKETRLYLEDGQLYAVYPGRAVNFVDRHGKPQDGGEVSRQLDFPLW